MIQQLKNIYHLLIATAANTIHLFPSRNLYVIGVTGTDGKTTTTSLIYHILKTAGKKVAMVTTVGAQIGDASYDTGFHTTTPSSLALQKYIKSAVQSGNEYLVLEVTSHALDQHRAAFIPFKIGVLTNVTHEHLDYHKTYENYVRAKSKLLKGSQVAVVNKDDESYTLLSKMPFMKSKRVVTYGLHSNSDYNDKNTHFKTHLMGEFNTLNSLAAYAVAKQLDIPEDTIKDALLSFKPPQGRQEVVYEKDFTVMIDFAHTPNAFERLLSAIQKETKGRIIHVFGAAGERDSSKRPLMGETSSKYADVIILTSEDPRSESVSEINKEIKKGVSEKRVEFLTEKGVDEELSKNKKYLIEIPDRKKAIECAIRLARKGDYVVLTGKSHEKSMNMGKGEEPWDEFKAVEDALKKKS